MKTKTLQEQYNSIKEGKGNKDQFLKQARSLFPQHVTKFLDYDTSVKVLKSKQIISESEITAKTPTNAKFDIWDWKKSIVDKPVESENGVVYAKDAKSKEDFNKNSYDSKDTKNSNNINFNEILKGFYAELKDEKNHGKTAEELRDIAIKNLSKDPLYYTKDGSFGMKGVLEKDEAPGLSKNTKTTDKDSSILGGRDKVEIDSAVVKNSANAVTKSNTKDNLSDSEAKTTGPKKVKEMDLAPQNSKGVKKFDTPGKTKTIKLKLKEGQKKSSLTLSELLKEDEEKDEYQNGYYFVLDSDFDGLATTYKGKEGSFFKVEGNEIYGIKSDRSQEDEAIHASPEEVLDQFNPEEIEYIGNELPKESKEGDIIVLKDDPSMDIKAGNYTVIHYGIKDNEPVYILKSENGKEVELTADYVEGTGYWKNSGVGVGKFSPKLNEDTHPLIDNTDIKRLGDEFGYVITFDDDFGYVQMTIYCNDPKNLDETFLMEIERILNKEGYNIGWLDEARVKLTSNFISFPITPNNNGGERAPKEKEPSKEKGRISHWSSIGESTENTFKIGDIVIPNVGPHKGREHKVIYVREDGKYNIQPLGLSSSQIQYKLGAAAATADQLTKKIEESNKLRTLLTKLVKEELN